MRWQSMRANLPGRGTTYGQRWEEIQQVRVSKGIDKRREGFRALFKLRRRKLWRRDREKTQYDIGKIETTQVEKVMTIMMMMMMMMMVMALIIAMWGENDDDDDDATVDPNSYRVHLPREMISI